MSITEVALAMSQYNRSPQHHAELCKAIANCPLAELKTPEGQKILEDYLVGSEIDLSDAGTLLFAPSRVRVYAQTHVEIWGEVSHYNHRQDLEACIFDLIREFMEQCCEPCRKENRDGADELAAGVVKWAEKCKQEIRYDADTIAGWMTTFVFDCLGGYVRIDESRQPDLERAARAFANLEEDMGN